MRKFGLAIFACLLFGAPAVFADSFQLNCTGVGVCGQTSWGTISVTSDGLIADQVDVIVTLSNAFFVNTGNHHSFAFGLSSSPTAVGFLDQYSQDNFTFLGGGAFANPPFGTFGFAFDCIQGAPDGCGPGGSNTTAGPLEFYVQGSGFTPATFVANIDNIFFAADLLIPQASGAPITGAIGSMYGTSTGNPIPEPNSLLLFGSGLVGLACAIRLKLRKHK